MDGVCRSNLHPKEDKGESTGEKMSSVCRFYGPGKVYDRVNREALWQVLRMYDMGGKLLNGIKSV